MSPPSGLRAAVLLAAATLTLLATPIVVLAHAELETATPADGSLLDVPPTEIVLTFTEELDPDSHMELNGPDGAQVASGGVDPGNALAMRIEPPGLEPGAYQILSTAIAAHDGAVARETLAFTISEPTPAPTERPTATPSASPSATAVPSAAPSVAPSPSPSTEGTAGGAADIILPIVALILIVAVLGAWLLNRSRGRGTA